jgi:hypothetical protein
MKVKLTRESDFKEVEVEVNDELIEVATKVDSKLTNPLGFICSEDGSKVFVYHKTRERTPGEKDSCMYKITVEKIPYQ